MGRPVEFQSRTDNMTPAQDASQDNRSDFFDALRKGLLLGAAVLILALPPRLSLTSSFSSAPSRGGLFASAPRLASFGDEPASADVRHVAHWAVHSGDHKAMSFVVIDKKDAKVYLFNPRGELQAATPALLGSAFGDHTVPGIGDKPLSLVLPEERTTPAGRFVAEPGMNLNGEDIVWVDYDAAVSMHRVRPLVKAEQRLERLASETPDDNRISFGCINLPVSFYETELSPTVKRTGAIVYVLPETRTPREVFGSYDVPSAANYAKR